MICDTIDNLRKYAGVDPRFNAIADFVERNDLAAIADGSYEVCDGVKVNISTYEPGSGGDFEAARRKDQKGSIQNQNISRSHLPPRKRQVTLCL